MADENKIYFDENGKAFTRSNSDTQSNQEIQEQDFKNRDDYLQALATKAWEDYASKADLKPTWEGEGSDEFANKVKRPFQFSNYLSHKVAEPIYKGVDVVAKRLGDKIGDVVSKIKGYSASDRVKALMKQYDEMNEDNIDFGDNANREGYGKAGEYFGAKDKYEKDYQTYRNALDDPNAWYADMNGEDVLTEPEEPNKQFASLTGTGSYKNWKPESKVGKIAKGASGIAGDMLPEMLEGWGGEVAMGALAPFYKKVKGEKEAANMLRGQAASDFERGREANAAHHNYMANEREASVRNAVDEKLQALKRERHRRYDLEHADNLVKSNAKRRMEELKNKLTPKQYQDLLQSEEYTKVIDDPSDFLSGIKAEREAALNNNATLKSIARNAKGEPKPLPNPAAQRAEALARNRQLAQEAEFNQALADLTEGKQLKDLSLDDMDDIIEQAEMRAKGVKAKNVKSKSPSLAKEDEPIRIKLSDTDNMVEIPIAKKPAQEWWEVHDPFKYDTGGFVEDAIEHAPTTIQNAFYDVASAEDADKIVRRLSRAVRNGVLKTDKDIESALIDILDDYFGGDIR